LNAKGQCWTYKEGSVGLATSGSGDTLAGVIVGLLARGARPENAAQWGVYLHWEAGNSLARSEARYDTSPANCSTVFRAAGEVHLFHIDTWIDAFKGPAPNVETNSKG
jgi:NAD(P)H-hydrate repair Nnr-like enzyme with NAD(P)H-hydrate dehydratase domain